MQMEEKRMRKRVITAFMLAATLVFAPMPGELSMIVNAAEDTAASDEGTAPDEAATATVSGGNARESGSTETTGKTQLAAPTGLQWGEKTAENENWNIVIPEFAVTWNAVENADTYRVTYYRDGNRIGSERTSGIVGQEIVTGRFTMERFTESGAYQFSVQSLASQDSDTFADSEQSELSPVYNYVKPEAALGEVTCYWSDTMPGTICWQKVEGAVRYSAALYLYDEATDSDRLLLRTNTGEMECDYSYAFERYGAGKYRCTIRALSSDIATLANGAEGGFSEYYDTTIAADTVSSIIGNAMGNGTAREALETIRSEIDNVSLRIAMQTDDTVLNQIKNLESAYAAEQGITVNAPVVSEEAGAYVKADAVSVVGAGLNATAGQEVRLEVSVPAEKEELSDSYYGNRILLDIQLKRNGESVHELDTPVTITLPLPDGLDAGKLVILHYSENGNFERVNFRMTGDGMVTFTVGRFSTFAFAEQKTENQGADQDQSGSVSEEGNQGQSNSVDGQGDDGGSEEGASDSQEDIADRIVNAGSGEIIRVKGVTALSNSIMQELLRKGDVTLVLEYTYEGVDYVVTIPAGAAVNDDIPWYGPLYLAGRYGNGSKGAVRAAGASYTVQSGDTMGKIARANGMTLNQLAEKNPQVKNIDYIVVGQKINVR